jgi:hypothetical protein
LRRAYDDRVQGLAIRTSILAVLAFVLAVPAFAQEPVDNHVDFTLGRVLRTTPDAMGRIGIRSICAEPHGCKVTFSLMHGTTNLGGNQVALLGGTTETDYVTLAKKTVKTLRTRRWVVTVVADVRDPAGNQATFTKKVTLGPKKRRR